MPSETLGHSPRSRVGRICACIVHHGVCKQKLSVSAGYTESRRCGKADGPSKLGSQYDTALVQAPAVS